MTDTGRIVKCHSNFFDLLLDRGVAGRGVARCVLRGRLRLERRDILAGDLVEVSPVPDGSFVVQKVLPRRNRLLRPPVANVDTLLVVFTVKEPPFNYRVVDKILVIAETRGLEALVCLNKADLCGPGEIESALEPYRKASYRTVVTSARTRSGIGELRGAIGRGVVVLAGQSGVGKSSILNALIPGSRREVGDISRKRNAGRHTTKGVDLLVLPGSGGLVADTPGFSRLELEALTREEVAGGFPEIRRLEGQCRFSDCAHRHEPECAVKTAVAVGAIGATRYESYIAMLDEAELYEQRRYR
ncbi:MAG: ribosome small subunit-dependent GTPase A [Ignavibacteriales bacterium]